MDQHPSLKMSTTSLAIVDAMAEAMAAGIPIGIPPILTDLTIHKVVTTTTAETEVPLVAEINSTIEVTLVAVEPVSEVEDALVDASAAADTIPEDDMAVEAITLLNQAITCNNTFMIQIILLTVKKQTKASILLRVEKQIPPLWVIMPFVLLEATPRVIMPIVLLEAMHSVTNPIYTMMAERGPTMRIQAMDHNSNRTTMTMPSIIPMISLITNNRITTLNFEIDARSRRKLDPFFPNHDSLSFPLASLSLLGVTSSMPITRI